MLLALPATICWGIYRWLVKRSQKAARLFLFLPVAISLITGYFVYTAFYPTDDFYEKEFHQITSLPFPKAGSIIDKDASYPDQHGDYSACARIEVPAPVYQHILHQVTTNTTLSLVTYAYDSTFISSEPFTAVAGNIEPALFAYRLSGGSSAMNAYRFIGFLTDRKTIIIYRCSS
ncbi:hypothetical protein [Hymenobacter sp. BT190]|uniref:hypothetical protein n=1 Tax=Hymenobacter sp. BT190 TaxID=2763505 RepID=UPI0016514CD4|nr:hypothetical protein [Hymenobacter sp. BT190]MBC6697974.1 hypothetical protein [Hymenobacter sp. BT190]